MTNTGYIDYVIDTLSQFGQIRVKKMFGSYGLYKDNIFFAIISDDTLYFKISEIDKPLYEKHGCKPLCYTKKDGKPIVLSYWEVPADIIENREKFALWVNRAVKAAQQKKEGIA